MRKRDSNCLKCGKSFTRETAHQRNCPECKEERTSFYKSKQEEWYSHSVFMKLRKEVLDRYGNRCLICGIKDGEALVFPKLHIHHRDKDRTNNLLTNLLLVCHKCHCSIHAILKKRNHYVS